MGFFSWLGFGKPRDAPEGAKTERPGLPAITDNVRDSGQTFFFGTASSGERVDEKSAMQISTVYACVRLLAETVAGLPLHLYRYTGNGDAKEKALDHPLYKILYRKPNPEMTSFTFRETMMTHLLLWGNAYAQIIRDGKNTVLGLYPLLPENVEVDRDEAGNLYFLELRSKRNALWEQTKAFLEKNRGENGLVAPEAVEQYNKMAQEVKDLGTEIERLEQQAQLDAQLAAPTSTPVHGTPRGGTPKDKNPRPTATDEYRDAFCANSHFLRTAGPHFPDSPGHIKRTAWDISRAEGTPPH